MRNLVQRLARNPRLQRWRRRQQMKIRHFDDFTAALPKTVCVDVGASYYAHTTWWVFLESKNTSWLAVEPNEESLQYLNGWPWKANALPITSGLSESGGEQTLFVTNADTGSSLFKPHVSRLMEDRLTSADREYLFPISERVISTQSLQEILIPYKGQPSFIKLDTQGSELSILRSVVHPDTNHDVLGIEIECSLVAEPTYTGAPRLWDVADYLEPLGYELILLDVFPRAPSSKLSSRPRSLPVECDAVFARKRYTLINHDVEAQISLIAFYLTNNLFKECSVALSTFPKATELLSQRGVSIDTLRARLNRQARA